MTSPLAGDETLPAPPSLSPLGARDSQPAMTSARDHAQLLPIDASHYDLGGELGRGGMGRIVKARDRRLGRAVAIKELLAQPEVDRDTVARDDRRARFEREARITARLQHPSIVSVLEAGTTADGEPFYVMRLVTGTSFDVAIAARPALAGRLALLPNLIAAADALAYAHSMRIVHRDLKPANILVGEFGETVVIDWGLAKDLAGTDEVATGVPVSLESSGAGETVIGAVMGTPAYMPREQAMGSAVDERADVYALGAILYQLLANRAPYAATTSREVLAQVLASAPEPIAKLLPRLSRDLAAIVDKAMARDRADRYPTAKALADDLKKFQTGQLVGAHRYSAWQLARRWVRRHRGAVAVGALAIGVLAAFGIASAVRIVREQEQTETERRDAEDLATFMLDDLQGKLLPTGRIDVLEGTARLAIAHYEKRGAGVPLDAAALAALSDAEIDERLKLARAYVLLGDARSAAGQSTETLANYRRARSLFESYRVGGLSAHAAGAVRDNLSVTYDRIGGVLRERGDAEGARASFRAGIAVDEERLAAAPDNDTIRENLAIGHGHLGAVLDHTWRPQDARAEYRAAIALADAAAAHQPNRNDYAMASANTHSELGQISVELGETAVARTEIATALAIATGVVASAPDDVRWWSMQATFEDTAARVEVADHAYAAAIAAFETAHALRHRLLLHEPERESYQSLSASNAEQLGNLYVQHGGTVEGIAVLREGVAIADKLAATDRADISDQVLAANIHADLAAALADGGDHANALRELVAVRELLVPAAELAPRDAHVTDSRARARAREGGELALLGKPDEAAAAFADAIEIATARVRAENTDEARGYLSAVEDLVGDGLAAAADRRGALAHYQAERELDTRDLAGAPADMERVEELAASTDKVAGVLLELGDVPGAIRELRASLALSVTRAAAKGTSDVDAGDAQLALGKRHAALGAALLRAKGSRAEAVTETQAAIGTLEAARPHVVPPAELDAELAKARAQLAQAQR